MGALWVAKGPMFLKVANLDSDSDCAEASQTVLNLCSICMPVSLTLCGVPAWSCNVFHDLHVFIPA